MLVYFLALIKDILFRCTITAASIDISSNMQGLRKVISNAGWFPSWSIVQAFVGGTV